MQTESAEPGQPVAPHAPAQVTPVSAQVAQALKPIKKLVVAIHGIGNQRRGETIRSVAYWFGDQTKTELPLVPIGFFSSGGNEIHFSRLESPNHEFSDVGFAEVYWADIPRAAVDRKDTLEETKAWGRSVAGRAAVAHDKLLAHQKERRDAGEVITSDQAVRRIDFHRCSVVIEEIVESIKVLDSVFFLFDKLGVFRFELGPVLRDYLDDVQTVTEFATARDTIVDRFDGGLASLFEKSFQNEPPELYIVAHSEGSVVAFLGLLKAISRLNGGLDAGENLRPGHRWVERVRGFMTIGSPIDKHLILWPHLFQRLELACDLTEGEVRGKRGSLLLPQQIAWRNYYDFGDPIGFELDTAVQKLREWQCTAFQFEKEHNFGFGRSWVPGKAHNDYWKDAEVFGHFINHVVKPQLEPVKRPATQWLKNGVCNTIPFALSLLLHIVSVFMLYKGVTAFITAGEKPSALGLGTTREMVLLGSLMFCTTYAARVPRLVNRVQDWPQALLATAAVCVAALACLLAWPGQFPSDRSLTELLPEVVPIVMRQARAYTAAPAVFVLAAIACVLSGWIVWGKERQGRRWLLVLGAAFVVVLVAQRTVGQHAADEPLWPLFLSGAAFLYLWWLGIILFDLSFIWRRYIRSSAALKAFRPREKQAEKPKSDRPRSWRVAGRAPRTGAT
jgi:hypothetical protein